MENMMTNENNEQMVLFNTEDVEGIIVRKPEYEVFGPCPVCGGDVVKSRKHNYYCLNDTDEDFHFVLYEYHKRFRDTIHLDDEKVRTLLSGGAIDETITTRKGRKRPVQLIIDVAKKEGKTYTNLVEVNE